MARFSFPPTIRFYFYKSAFVRLLAWTISITEKLR